MDNIIFNLSASDNLLTDIQYFCKECGVNLEIGDLHLNKFSDNEISAYLKTSVRGKRVYLLASPNSSDKIMELMLILDSAKRAAAKEIIPIITYMPYSRSDKKDESRGPIGAKVIAEMFENAGSTSIILFDLHCDQIQGFFNIPVTHLEGKYIFDDIIKAEFEKNNNIILGSCDAGGVKRLKRIRNRISDIYNIDLPIIIMDKTRSKVNNVDNINIIGDVIGKDVILIDDIVDTFGSANKGIEGLINNGAKSVKMIASHPVLSGPAMDRISTSKLVELIVTNSLTLDTNSEKIKIVSISKSISLAISAIELNTSFENILG